MEVNTLDDAMYEPTKRYYRWIKLNIEERITGLNGNNTTSKCYWVCDAANQDYGLDLSSLTGIEEIVNIIKRNIFWRQSERQPLSQREIKERLIDYLKYLESYSVEPESDITYKDYSTADSSIRKYFTDEEWIKLGMDKRIESESVNTDTKKD